MMTKIMYTVKKQLSQLMIQNQASLVPTDEELMIARDVERLK